MVSRGTSVNGGPSWTRVRSGVGLAARSNHQSEGSGGSSTGVGWIQVRSVVVHPDIDRVVRAFDHKLSPNQEEQLHQYMSWLRREAIPAGGLGPAEASQLENRHIADSLLYLPPDLRGETLLDIGSGVGLPGLVLAIAHPEMAVTLVDRSGRRLDLLRRAVRVVNVDNVHVVRAEVGREAIESADVVTMRAVLPPAEAVVAVAAYAERFGVVGLSRTRRPDDVPGLCAEAEALGFEGRVFHSDILDPPSWLLIMTRT